MLYPQSPLCPLRLLWCTCDDTGLLSTVVGLYASQRYPFKSLATWYHFHFLCDLRSASKVLLSNPSSQGLCCCFLRPVLALRLSYGRRGVSPHSSLLPDVPSTRVFPWTAGFPLPTIRRLPSRRPRIRANRSRTQRERSMRPLIISGPSCQKKSRR